MRVTIILIFISSIAYSQANYLEDGERGAYLGLGLYSGNNQTDLLLGGGFSPNGLFEISGALQRATIDEDFGLRNAYGLGLNAHLKYFVIKQSDIPLQLDLTVGSGIGRVTSDEIKAIDWDITSFGYSIGSNVYYDIESNTNISIQPYGSIHYNVTKIKVDTNGFGSENDSDTKINFSLGVNLLLDLDYNNFAISPQIIFQEGGTRFGIQLSYIFR